MRTNSPRVLCELCDLRVEASSPRGAETPARRRPRVRPDRYLPGLSPTLVPTAPVAAWRLPDPGPDAEQMRAAQAGPPTRQPRWGARAPSPALPFSLSGATCSAADRSACGFPTPPADAPLPARTR